MAQYLLLLYAAELDEAGMEERWSELPLWDEITDSLREAGVLLLNRPLGAAVSAKTVRIRNDRIDATDGPFALTKEVLAGFYLIECSDLESAVEVAARLPTARYGSVEVRPILALQSDPGHSSS